MTMIPAFVVTKPTFMVMISGIMTIMPAFAAFDFRGAKPTSRRIVRTKIEDHDHEGRLRDDQDRFRARARVRRLTSSGPPRACSLAGQARGDKHGRSPMN